MENNLINILYYKNIDIINYNNIKTNKYKDFIIEYKTNIGGNGYIINNICKDKNSVFELQKSMLVNEKYIYLLKHGFQYSKTKYIKFTDIFNYYSIHKFNNYNEKKILKNDKIHRKITYNNINKIYSYEFKNYISKCEYKNNLLYIKQIGIYYIINYFKDNLKYYKNFKLIL